MSDCLVFNHHSLPYDSKELAEKAVPEFLRICVRGQEIGLNFILVDETIHSHWFRVELASGYYFQDWFNKNKKKGESRDHLRAFLSISTRQPLFSSDDIDKGVQGVDVKLTRGDASYNALLAAFWNDAPLTGFPTRKPWNLSPIKIVTEKLGDAGEIEINDNQIINLYSEEIFESIAPSLEKALLESVRNGKDLLAKSNKLYPYITYCGEVQEQLSSWSHSPKVLYQVKESLRVLNEFTSGWQTSKFASFSYTHLRSLGLNHEVSGESVSVSQKSALRKKREFWLPSGKKAYFESHIKLSKGFRVHFYVENINKIIYVGYIGPHLPLK